MRMRQNDGSKQIDLLDYAREPHRDSKRRTRMAAQASTDSRTDHLYNLLPQIETDRIGGDGGQAFDTDDAHLNLKMEN